MLFQVERILRVDLTVRQRQYYKDILTKNYSALKNIKQKSSSLMNIVMELKKCCNHTGLIDLNRLAPPSDNAVSPTLGVQARLLWRRLVCKHGCYGSSL